MKVRIYGTPSCGYCVQAKNFCEQNGLEYEYTTISDQQQLEQLQEKVGQPFRTVPQIFINEDGFDEYVGGFDQLKEKFNNG